MTDRIHCAMCGRSPDAEREGDPPLGWTAELDDDRRVCPECTRAHVRSIEAKLDRGWW